MKSYGQFYNARVLRKRLVFLTCNKPPYLVSKMLADVVTLLWTQMDTYHVLVQSGNVILVEVLVNLI